jgi:hypothetical protein
MVWKLLKTPKSKLATEATAKFTVVFADEV